MIYYAAQVTSFMKDFQLAVGARTVLQNIVDVVNFLAGSKIIDYIIDNIIDNNIDNITDNVWFVCKTLDQC